ncbi:type II secretion system protein GspE [Candidatus Kuenenbacteria bacterium CG10_big_fil_rev_8_21_14_0_10_36_11]|uniref:Type II secretion system protein GspE n=1 Tax=Candidatus Kuenenbacteria bacterium CG10_big_fil_rev_8_21_14_0_10_36_11 TaxID=1974618 RepID=A0A2M6WB27_9BACT|nr:MAG: type II secretion system protein GspE [Candidatus Kuenenbacteria bacterium CG10_big_fil_rev_8_21_14_0_10_36_11]
MKNINDLLQENRDTNDHSNGASNSISDSSQNNKDDSNLPPSNNYHESEPDKAAEALALKMKEMHDKRLEEELKHKATDLGFGYVNLKGIPITADTLQILTLEETRTKKIICFYFAPHGVARFAMISRDEKELRQIMAELKSRLEIAVEFFLTSEISFNSALKQYEAVPQIHETPHGVEITAEDLDKFSGQLTSLVDVMALIHSASTTELVAVIIAAGLKTDSSDIHIEAEVDGIKLRYRVDGVLHTAGVLDKSSWQQLISRLKLLSGLKLNIFDKPQDGRFSILLKDDKIDVRVSTLPTNYGESVVMRLLMSRVASLSLKDLGLEEKYYQLLQDQIKRPNGMLITTGPTGSGKTTTLYAVLNQLNTSETKIITIEDPIEYELKGVNQSQVDQNRDYTFAKGLRSIVRQDPDVIMVGEMRDLETVDIALNAALTGHLVFSTLHTNDAAGAIPRFLAMGAKPYLLAPALNLIIAQRLVRKLCDSCKKEMTLDNILLQKIKDSLGETLTRERIDLSAIKFYGPTGCDKCNGLGYKGRIGIFEMFTMDKEVEQVILSNEVSEYKIRDLARAKGMISLVEDGLLKAIRGITSVDEVFRVAE